MAGDLQQGRASRQRSDRELVDDAVHASTAAAQAAAFTEIFKRHHGAVLRYCSRQLHEHAGVEDAAADAFEAAFTDLQRGLPPRDPDKLRAWLLGIARHRCLTYMRGRQQDDNRKRPMAALDALLRDDNIAEELLDDDADESGTRRRQAQADRLVAVVAATFDEQWQRIYELSVIEGLRGRQLAVPLGVTAAEASRLANDIKNAVVDGFGALVLARDGRRFCPRLAQILDTAAWNGENFTGTLRIRILQHLDSCRQCDNCTTCNRQRKPLIAAYSPALIPPLIAPDVRERVDATIARLCPTTRAARSSNYRRRRRRPRRGLLLLLLLLLLVLITAAIPLSRLLLVDSPNAAAPSGTTPPAAALPASLAGTWQLASFNQPGVPSGGRQSRWLITGSCEQPNQCSFTWQPLTTTTTFETNFLPPPTGQAQRNDVEKLVLRPAGNRYSGTGIAAYGQADVSPTGQATNFGTSADKVTLQIQITKTATRSGKLIATRFTVTVQYANYYAGPCPDPSNPCDRGAAEQAVPKNLLKTETLHSTAIRIG
jgi:RNA polymerase sigma factor (sigma-70 family)